MKLINLDTLKRILTNALKKIEQYIAQKEESASSDVPASSGDVPEPAPEPQETPTEEKPEEATEEATFDYTSFGRPNCAKAVEDKNTQIKDFKWSRSGMSYKWAKGNLANWGISDKHDASALAVAGYFDGKKWRFAKFDWISTDRLTRDHKNIEEHYNGFPDEYFSATKHGFFIMSKDGKRRTNVLTV